MRTMYTNNSFCSVDITRERDKNSRYERANINVVLSSILIITKKTDFQND